MSEEGGGQPKRDKRGQREGGPSTRDVLFTNLYYIKQRCSGDLSIRSVDLDETLQGSSGDISKNFLFWGQPCPRGRRL